MTSPKVRSAQSSVQLTLRTSYGVTHHRTWAPGYVDTELDGIPGKTLAQAEGTGWAGPALEGQEFLRLASCNSTEAVSDFVRAFGASGLIDVARRFPAPPLDATYKIPLVLAVASQTFYALDRYPDMHTEMYEFVEDLRREAALLRAVVEVGELARDPALRKGAIRRMDRVLSHTRPSKGSFGGVPVLGALEDAGLIFQRAGGSGRFIKFQSFPARLNQSIRKNRNPLTVVASPSLFEYRTASGMWDFVSAVLNPVVGLVEREVMAQTNGLRIVARPSVPHMLPITFVEAAEALAAGARVHECEWTGCPPAPGRQHLFLFRSDLSGDRDGNGWAWRRTPERRRRRTGSYCSLECASAASTEKSRETKAGNTRSTADSDRRKARTASQ